MYTVQKQCQICLQNERSADRDSRAMNLFVTRNALISNYQDPPETAEVCFVHSHVCYIMIQTS